MEQPAIVLISDSDGMPKTVALRMRESETAPGRLKVHFAVSTTSGLTGRGVVGVSGSTPLPIPEDAPDEVPISPEFRIEMN
jgi:hypothetical protein